MSSMTAPVRRSGGDLDVYTGLLFAAFLVLLAGLLSVALREHRPGRERPPTGPRRSSPRTSSSALPGFDVVK